MPSAAVSWPVHGPNVPDCRDAARPNRPSAQGGKHLLRATSRNLAATAAIRPEQPGGLEVPSSNLGAPTEKPAGNGGLFLGAALCKLVKTTLYVLGEILELVGIACVAALDLVPGGRRFSGWAAPRWRRFRNRLRRLVGLPLGRFPSLWVGPQES